MPSVVGHSTSISRHLEWDSKHFGIPVAEIASLTISDEDLHRELTNAREAGYGLVYLRTSLGRCVAELLEEFGGLFVNHRITFRKDMSALDNSLDIAISANGFRIESLPQGPAPMWLQELAITAGHCSRFNVDYRLPIERCHELYRIWAKRSALGELADRIWFAIDSTDPQRPAGFITVSECAQIGEIGLIAVSHQHRGHGIASQLIQQAHSWLRDREATKVSVVTQLENEAACRLYSRCGYRIGEAYQCFHFVLSANQTSR